MTGCFCNIRGWLCERLQGQQIQFGRGETIGRRCVVWLDDLRGTVLVITSWRAAPHCSACGHTSGSSGIHFHAASVRIKALWHCNVRVEARSTSKNQSRYYSECKSRALRFLVGFMAIPFPSLVYCSIEAFRRRYPSQFDRH